MITITKLPKNEENIECYRCGTNLINQSCRLYIDLQSYIEPNIETYIDVYCPKCKGWVYKRI